MDSGKISRTFFVTQLFGYSENSAPEKLDEPPKSGTTARCGLPRTHPSRVKLPRFSQSDQNRAPSSRAMRRFPGCWTEILPSLGFRRILKSAKSESSRRRRSQIERLEERQMLSASPLEESFVFDVAATLESPTAQFATLEGEALPTIDTTALPLETIEVDAEPDAPVRAQYVLANPGRGNNPNQFRIETEFDEKGAARAVVRLLESQLSAGNLDTSLQELHLELRAGSVVLERQEVLIDIAEADFRAKFLQSRVDVAKSAIQNLNQPGSEVTAVEETPATELTPTLTNSAAPETELAETIVDIVERKEKLADLTVDSSAEDIAAVAQLHADFGNVAETSAEKLKLLNLLSAAIVRNDAKLATSELERTQKLTDQKLLGQSTLLLSSSIAAELDSFDPAIKAAAELARDAALTTVSSEFTVFTGLGKNQELRRGASAQGSGELVLGAVEEGAFQANASLRLELGGQQAMVQVTRRMGTSSSGATAPLQVETLGPTGDTYTTESPAGAVSGSASELTVSGTTGNKKTAYLRFDLSAYTGTSISAAALNLKNLSGAGTNRIAAYKDLFAPSTLWSESSLSASNAGTLLQAGFTSPITNWVSNTAGQTSSIDVSDAVRRATLLGDSNGTGSIDYAGPRGDVNAFYWAVTDVAIYQQAFPNAAVKAENSTARNDSDWNNVITTGDIDSMFKRWGVSRGDFNLDNVVDIKDYSVWSANFNQRTLLESGGFTAGDFNFDRVIDAADYGEWNETEGSSGVAPNAPSLTLRVEAVDANTVQYYSKESSYSPQLKVAREFVVNSLEDLPDLNTTDGVADVSSAPGEQSTLRAAIQQIHALAADPVNAGLRYSISFASEVRGKIELGSELSISTPITISGPGAELLTLSGRGINRIFNVGVTAVTIRGLTLADGYSIVTGPNGPDGGAIFSYGETTLENVAVRSSRAARHGGGIYVTGANGKLTLRNSTIDSNQAGVTEFGSGGGLYLWATRDDALIIERSTISRNTAGGSGAILFAGAGTSQTEQRKGVISDSTISGNSATYGGGLSILWLSSLITISNSTITNNKSSDSNYGGGLALRDGGQAILNGSIIAGNENSTAGPKNISRNDQTGTAWTDAVARNRVASRSNIFGNSGPDTWTNTNPNFNLVLSNNDPQLLPLANYGGATETHLPLDTSPAVNGVNRRSAYDALIKSHNSQTHFSFDNTTASSIAGASSATLSPGGGATFVTGSAVGSHALNLNPSLNSYADASVSVGASFSYETWAKSSPEYWNNWNWLGIARGSNGFAVSPIPTTKGWKAFVADSGGNFHLIGEHYPLDVQGWHHYAVTFDALTGRATMYFDGQVVVSTTMTINRQATPATLNLRMGADIVPPNWAAYGHGVLDEVALYNSVLTPAQIAEHVSSFDQRGVTRLPPGASNQDIGSSETQPSIVAGADFDGDGRDDKIFQDPTSLAVYVMTGPAESKIVRNWGLLPERQANADAWKIGDFDGDGRDDLAVRGATGRWYVALSESTRFKIFDATPVNSQGMPSWLLAQTFVGDFDGDGRDELLGRTSNTGSWRRWTYSDEAGLRAFDTGVTTLTSATQTLYIGDTNRDGKDDLIAKDGAIWSVSLATGQSSSVSFLSKQDWAGNWFTAPATGATIEADKRYQELLDIFSSVYNDIEMQVYPGLMKGIEATFQTKSGNDWDQAALLVDRLDQAQFHAKIAFGSVTLPALQLAKWLGVKESATEAETVANVLKIINEGLDANADDDGTTITFRHAWVEVEAPSDTGYGWVRLDPSMKFKDRQAGLKVDLTTFQPGLGAHGTFNEFAYLADPNFVSDGYYTLQAKAPTILPIEWYEQSVAYYLRANSATLGGPQRTLADVVYDGPVIRHNSVRLPITTSATSYLYTSAWEDLNELVTQTTPASILDSAPYSHQTVIGIYKNSATTSEWTHRISVPQNSLSQITVEYVTVNTGSNQYIKPTLYVDGSLAAQSSANSGFVSGNTAKFTIKNHGPAALGFGTQSTDEYQRKAFQVHAITLDATQFASPSLTSHRDALIDNASDGAISRSDIADMLDLAGRDFYSTLADRTESIGPLLHAIPVTTGVRTGLVTSDNSTVSATASIIANLPYGFAPLNMYVDLHGRNQKMLDAQSTTLDFEAVQLGGWTASALESEVIEKLINSQAISTIRGVMNAYHDVSGVNKDASNEPAKVAVFESYLENGATKRIVFRGYAGYGVPAGSADAYNPTGNVGGFLNSGTGVSDRLPKHTITGIAGSIWASLQANNVVQILVPYHQSSVGGVSGWEGSVYVEERPGTWLYAIAQNNGPTSNGGATGNVSFELTTEIPDGSYDHAAFAGDPVTVANGNMFRDETDFVYDNLGYPLSFSRHYDSQSKFDVGLGVGWVHSFSDRLLFNDPLPAGQNILTYTPDVVNWLTSSGALLTFEREFAASTTPRPTPPRRASQSAMEAYVAALAAWERGTPTDNWKSPDTRFGVFKEIKNTSSEVTGYKWRGSDGQEYQFDRVTGDTTTIDGMSWTPVGRLASVLDRNGHGIKVSQYRPNLVTTARASFIPVKVEDAHDNRRYVTFGGETVNTSSRIPSVKKWVPIYAGGSTVPTYPSTGAADAASDLTLEWTLSYTSIAERSYLTNVARPNGASLFGQIADGAVQRYQYYSTGSVAGLMQKITEYDGAAHDYEYYLNRRVFRVTESLGGGDSTSQTFEYNQWRNATYFTDENQAVETYIHNDSGLLVKQIHSDRTFSLKEYGTTTGNKSLLVRSLDDLGAEETFDYLVQGESGFQRPGKLQSSKAANGVITNYVYQGVGASGGIDGTTGLGGAYDHILELASIQQSKKNSLNVVEYLPPTKLERDDRGNLKKTTDSEGNVTVRFLNTTAPLYGLPDKETRPVYSSGASTIFWKQSPSLLSLQQGDLIVELSAAAANTKVAADAILLERLENGLPVASWIIDDGDANFENLAASTATSAASGFGNDALHFTPSTTAPLARWKFANLPAGTTYRISFTWQVAALASATYTLTNVVAGQAISLPSVPISQSTAPATTGAHIKETQYFYNAQGRLTHSIIDGIVTARTQYDSLGAPRYVIDPTGIKSYSLRDYRGRVLYSGVEDPDGPGPLTKLETKFQYDPAARLVSTQDPLGRTTTATYDEKGRLTKEKLANGAETTSTYDDKGNRLTATDALGRTTQFVYNSRDRLTHTIYADGAIERLLYNGQGRIRRSIDARGNVTFYTYTFSGDHRTTTMAEGTVDAVTVYNKHDLFDRLTESVDGNGVVTKYKRDSLGRTVQVTVLDRSHVSSGENVTTINYAKAPVSVTSMTYDGNGRVVETVVYDPAQLSLPSDPLGLYHELIENAKTFATDTNVTAGKVRRIRTAYDALDRAVTATNNDGTTTKSAYDPSGRLLASRDELGRLTEFAYDSFGRLIKTIAPDPDGSAIQYSSPITTVTYDAVGNVLTATDPRGVTTRTAYDFLNRPIATTDGVGAERRSSYDIAGQMVAGIDARGFASYTKRDERGRVVMNRDVDPDGGGRAVAPTIITTYDKAGNASAMRDARGFTTTFEYDALNRTVKETRPQSLYGDNSNYYTNPNVVDEEFVTSNHASNYSTHTEGNPLAFGRDETRFAAPAAGEAHLNSRAVFYIRNVPAGKYRAYLTWTKLSGAITDPQVAIKVVNSSGVQTAFFIGTSISQSQSPASIYRSDDVAFRGWQDIRSTSEPPLNVGATVFNVSEGGRVEFLIEGLPANGSPLLADAVMLESVDSATSYTYDGNGNVLTTTDPQGNTSKRQYDELNRLQATTSADPDGSGTLRPLVAWNEFNGFNETTAQRQGHLTADLAGRLALTNVTLLRSDLMKYDLRGNLVSEELSAGAPESVRNLYVYDAVGNRRAEVLAFGSADQTIDVRSFDQLNRVKEDKTDVLQDIGFFGIVAATPEGVAKQELTAQGLVSPNLRTPVNLPTLYTYDASGNVLEKAEGSRIVNVNSTTYTYVSTAYFYDAVGRLIRQLDDAGGPLQATSTWTYDASGNVLVEVDPTGRRMLYEYDPLGRLTRTVAPDPDGVGAQLSPTTSYVYDAAGNVVEQTNGEGESVYSIYDATGRVVRTIRPVSTGVDTETVYRYDLVGNLISMRDGAYNTTRYSYDKLHRNLTETTKVALTLNDSQDATSIWTYDIFGRLGGVSDPTGRAITYQYDANNRIKTETWWDAHRTDFLNQQTVVNVYYNYQRDKLARITETTFSIGDYNPNNPSANNPANQRETYQYDNLGRVTERQMLRPFDQVGSTSQVVDQYQYDQAPLAGDSRFAETLLRIGHTQFVWASGGTTTSFQTYDSIDRLGRQIQTYDVSAYSNGSGGTNNSGQKSLNFNYDLAGRVVGTSGLRAANNFYASSGYEYDGAGRLKAIRHDANSGGTTFVLPVSTSTYTRDRAGRVVGSSTENSPLLLTKQEGAVYDDQGRLVNWTSTAFHANSATSVLNRTETDSFALDEAGNRTNHLNASGNSVANGRVVKEGNRLLRDDKFQYEYNKTGNLIKKIALVSGSATGATTIYTWDYRNRLYAAREFDSANDSTDLSKTKRSLVFGYDSSDRLIRKDIWTTSLGVTTYNATDSEQYVYNGSDRELTRNANGKVTHRYLYGPASPAPVVDEVFAADGTLDKSYWAFSDELGTVRDVVNGVNGALENHLEYDEHGAIRQVTKLVGGAVTTLTSSARALDAAFAGQFFDDDLKLAIHGARWYDPAAEIFISEDPANADANLYRYASNDPINFVDPSGLATQSPLEYLPAFGGGGSNQLFGLSQNFTVGVSNANALVSSPIGFGGSQWNLGSAPLALDYTFNNNALQGAYTGPTILGSGVTMASANANNVNRRPPSNTSVIANSSSFLTNTTIGQGIAQIANSLPDRGLLYYKLALSSQADEIHRADLATQQSFAAAWNAVKLWDNQTVTKNYTNVLGNQTGFGSKAFAAYSAVGTAVADNVGVSNLEDARSGREFYGGRLTTGERVFRGTVGGLQIVSSAVGLKNPVGFGSANPSVAPRSIASTNSASTGVARLDSLAAQSNQYSRFKTAIESRGIRVIENSALVDDFAMAQTRVNNGVIELLVDPSKTRYVDVLHEWRHIRQFEEASKTLQSVPLHYARSIEKGLEAGALKYEYRLSNILNKRQGTSLSSNYLQETLYRADQLNRTYSQKLHRSPSLQKYDAFFPFK